MRYSLIFIVGPTASGKTEIAIRLAEKINAEIISCDSMLVYKEPWLIVDKPQPEILKKIKHHMVNIISVEEEFNVFAFMKKVQTLIEKQYPDKNFILVGGSGLYFKSILDGIFEDGKPSWRLRKNLKEEGKKRGAGYLYALLKKVDPSSASQIHPKNIRRIIRALEVYYLSGKPFSAKKREARGLWGKFPIIIFGLSLPRETLYKKIEERIDNMVERGLIEEVKSLLKNYSLSRTARAILGIKEIEDYLEGKTGYEETISLLKKNTRRFAKRQLTWFKKDKRIEWIDIAQKSPVEVVEEILYRAERTF